MSTDGEMSAEQYRETAGKAKAHKYHAKPIVIDGIRFASTAEGTRYANLKHMERAGMIEGLVLQPRFPLEVNGHRIGTYVADFLYYDNERQARVIEDVKGVRTPVYRLKKKLMLALHGIEITETA